MNRSREIGSRVDRYSEIQQWFSLTLTTKYSPRPSEIPGIQRQVSRGVERASRRCREEIGRLKPGKNACRSERRRKRKERVATDRTGGRGRTSKREDQTGGGEGAATQGKASTGQQRNKTDRDAAKPGLGPGMQQSRNGPGWYVGTHGLSLVTLGALAGLGLGTALWEPGGNTRSAEWNERTAVDLRGPERERHPKTRRGVQVRI
jgi:hypothetical protein